MAPARSGLLAVRTDDVEDEPRSHFRHGLIGNVGASEPGRVSGRMRPEPGPYAGRTETLDKATSGAVQCYLVT